MNKIRVGCYTDIWNRNYQPLEGEIIYCTDDNSCYVYMDSHFKKFNIAENTTKKNYSNKVYSCPCCGAPHKPTEARCEYCGSYFIEEDE